MGVSVVVGAGTPVTRRGEGESDGGVGQRGGAMHGGSGVGRDAWPGMRAGSTKVAT